MKRPFACEADLLESEQPANRVEEQWREVRSLSRNKVVRERPKRVLSYRKKGGWLEVQ
jgi:hypothetical protein